MEPQVNASERDQGTDRKKESVPIGVNRWIKSEGRNLRIRIQ